MFERHLFLETLQVNPFWRLVLFFLFMTHLMIRAEITAQAVVVKADCVRPDLVSSTSWNRYLFNSHREVVSNS